MKIHAYLTGAVAVALATGIAAQLPRKDARGNPIAEASRQQLADYREWANEITGDRSGTPQILVDKSERTLSVYVDGKLLHTYPVSLGKDCPDLRAKQETAPEEARKHWDEYWGGSAGLPLPLIRDSCTPEGVFLVTKKYNETDLKPHWCGMSCGDGLEFEYPRLSDIERAHRRGDVTQGSGWRFLFQGLFRNPDLTVLGAVEGIHGKYDGKSDSTPYGSVGMTDSHIKEVQRHAQAGKTKVGIGRYLK